MTSIFISNLSDLVRCGLRTIAIRIHNKYVDLRQLLARIYIALIIMTLKESTRKVLYACAYNDTKSSLVTCAMEKYYEIDEILSVASAQRWLTKVLGWQPSGLKMILYEGRWSHFEHYQMNIDLNEDTEKITDMLIPESDMTSNFGLPITY